MPFYPKQVLKDHVFVNISLSVMIGVDPGQEDCPPEFCELLREAVKVTGAVILASSIVSSGKRKPYFGSTREQIAKGKTLEMDSIQSRENQRD